MSIPGKQTLSAEAAAPPGHFFRHDLPHVAPLGSAVERARRCLLSKQRADGHWCGELQGDTILESEYVMLLAFLGRESDPRVAKAARYILAQQNAAGGWSNYPGGPVDLSVSVKAYFALKLAGYDPDTTPQRRACAAIRALGGAAGCNSFTRFYLALLGQLPYDRCPAVPPEMIFLPRGAYFNIYAMSSWTRTIVIPLSIFYAHKPVRRLPAERGIAELFVEPAAAVPPVKRRLLSWHRFFLGIDRLLKCYDAGARRWPRWALKRPSWAQALCSPLAALRAAAVKRATAWMLDHCADSDGVGAIFPPMIYTVICLRCLGYADDSPEMTWALGQLDALMIEEGGTLRLQPCFSPVWDTALTLNALAATGMRAHQPPVARAVEWLLDREVRRPGDWSVMNPGLEPAGWFFEYRNGFYPDTDDTAMVLMGLARVVAGGAWGVGREAWGVASEDRHGQRNGHTPAMVVQANGIHGSSRPTPHGPRPTAHGPLATARAVRWLRAMQNRDGGWAAFDRDVNREVLTQVPFADHNAMLDPSCPDITARVLEALGQYGHRVGQPEVDRAVAFIRASQDRRGCWLGRWGVNYIYGTWQVLQGLAAVHFDMSQPMVRRAVAWLKQVQQPGGGWGESCRSYDEPDLAGQGTPTASQTAWALLGLLAAGEAHSPAVKAGIAYLVATQQADGGWREDQFTGTGFPKVFYLKYHLYCLYFPLMALGRYQQLAGSSDHEVVRRAGAAHRNGRRAATTLPD
jgi:squalene-hopene/tetraprenyl-beta-curcumene cyclase